MNWKLYFEAALHEFREAALRANDAETVDSMYAGAAEKLIMVLAVNLGESVEHGSLILAEITRRCKRAASEPPCETRTGDQG